VSVLTTTQCAFVGAFLLILSANVSAVPDMQEGQWENTIEMKMEMPGMPIAMPPMTHKTSDCLTKKDMVPNTAQEKQQCDVKDHKTVGNKVTWKIRCKDKEGTLEGDGEVSYAGTTYQGTMRAKSTPADKSMPQVTLTYKLTGRRIGACKK
jgi:hypothetical protein